MAGKHAFDAVKPSTPIRASLLGIWQPNEGGFNVAFLHDRFSNNAIVIRIDHQLLDNSSSETIIGHYLVRSTPPAIPEPSTLVLFVIGIVGILGIGYRCRKKAA